MNAPTSLRARGSEPRPGPSAGTGVSKQHFCEDRPVRPPPGAEADATVGKGGALADVEVVRPATGRSRTHGMS